MPHKSFLKESPLMISSLLWTMVLGFYIGTPKEMLWIINIIFTISACKLAKERSNQYSMLECNIIRNKITYH